MGFVENLVSELQLLTAKSSLSEFLVAIIVTISALLLIQKHFLKNVKCSGILPPRVPYYIPFIGSAITFGTSPLEFLHESYKKYGPVFSFRMFGRDCTYLIGSEATELFFNSKNDELNAEDVYGGLTIPVFGKGVVYDCDSKEFAEQKRISKVGLTISRFHEYVPFIEEEAHNYLSRFGDSGKFDLFVVMSQMVIMTASRCLLGDEIRSKLDDSVADLYHDLDGGFTPEAWMLPSWLPLPSFRVRDRAHCKIKKIFIDVIKARREENRLDCHDMISTYMTTPYRNGQLMTDDQIAGMCIALLLAGQHTSSTTSSWLGFFLCEHDGKYQKECYDEVMQVIGDDKATFDNIKCLELLDRCLKESLRLRPPLMTMMRMVRTPQTVMGFTIPVGNYICASPTVNQILDEAWSEAKVFNPHRFDEMKTGSSLEYDDGGEVATPGHGKYSYVPFGAGRHRCIGESFAYIQIKTIWSVVLREFELTSEKFPDIDYSTMIHTPKDAVVSYRRRTAVPSSISS